jgi:tRNA A37 threonylcarbamoyladenosine modification protein TsaB
MAKMISYGCGAKIVAVNTMDALISNIEELSAEQDIRRAAVVIDAKRGQFYVGVFELLEGKWQKKTGDCLLKPEEFVAQYGQQDELIWLLGEGLVYYSDKFKASGVRILDEKYWQVNPDGLYSIGQEMAENGLFTEAAEIVPIYLRQPEAMENWQKKTQN